MLRIHANSISTDKPTSYLIGAPTKLYGALKKTYWIPTYVDSNIQEYCRNTVTVTGLLSDSNSC